MVTLPMASYNPIQFFYLPHLIIMPIKKWKICLINLNLNMVSHILWTLESSMVSKSNATILLLAKGKQNQLKSTLEYLFGTSPESIDVC